MSADWVLKQGDVAPILTDTLTYSNGQPVNLTGATLTFIMRALSSSTPIALTGIAAITVPLTGKVSYTPTVGDTANAGMYMANWHVIFPSGESMTWPTEGYMSVLIEENLTTAGGAQIVGLPEVKDALGLPANDRVHDATLIGLIEDVAPLIEEHTGPIRVQRYEERFDGGNNIISLTHTPNYGFGTTPILTLLGVSEYRGPAEYPLQIVASPVYGSIYSCELDPRMGTITRRTAGGSTVAFMPGRNSIHAVYEAGQEVVPRNVQRAARETVRWWYRTTMAVGRGRETQADDEQQQPLVSLPYHCLAMLSPTKRYPSFA
jgi:hypothetical protein